MPAKCGQTASQLRLKDHYQGNCEENRETAYDPADNNQIQQLRNQRQRQKNDRQSGQHLCAARSAKIKVAVVDRHAQQNDFKSAAPSSDPEVNELIDHFVL